MNDISVEEGNEERQRDPESNETERTHDVVATLVEERSCYLVALPRAEVSCESREEVPTKQT
jgi:hypothetical protein